MASKSHAACSASGASRWLACPGSVWACSQVEDRSSPHAEEGTKAHELCEAFLIQCLQVKGEPPDWWSETIRENYTDEMIQSCIMYVDRVMAEIALFENPSVRIESKLTLHDEMKLYGTADVAITGVIDGEERGAILDLKYGKTKVVAKDNPQLAYYACAMRRTSKRNLQKIKVMIVQPRIKNPITEVEYGMSELDEWEKKLLIGAEKAYLQIVSDEREFVVGSHCKWCRGLSICPERNKAPGAEEGLEFCDGPDL